MKKFYYVLSVVPMMLTSCTVNDEGDLEFTWLFWLLLFVFFIFIVGSVASNSAEAKDRGMSVEQVIAEKKKSLEKKMMSDGFDVEYLGGYPRWTTPGTVKFRIEDSNIVLTRSGDRFVISKDMIVAISNEKSGQRSVGKTAAGAIVGGMLTGGLGLIVGGALGARKKDTSEVYVTYRYNGVELTLNLRPGKNADKVYAWINSVFA